jgi:hypothetical protein
MQPVLVDVGDHLVDDARCVSTYQDQSLCRGLGREESRPDRLCFRWVQTICVLAHASSSWPAE